MMTKKEKEDAEAALTALKVKLALRWTEPVKPDVPPPIGGSGGSTDMLTVGFLPLGTGRYARVKPACSSSIYHGTGRTDKTSSQNPMPLYSTCLLALRAMRYETEMEAAKMLYDIDQQIAKEIQKPTKLP